jgi:1,4-dihydroxy-2-naphthoate octaprenyltransferase
MLLASLPVALLIAAVLTINTLPDVAADRSAGKRTLAVVLGPKGAIQVYSALLLGAYLTLAVTIVAGSTPLIGLAALLPVPVAMWSILAARRSGGRVPEILPANAATIQLHLVTGLLLCLAYVFVGWTS